MSDPLIPANEIPKDVWAAAEEALDNMLCHCRESSGSTEAFRRDSINEIAQAILAERQKGEKLADQMYLTGVHDAYALAKRIGYQDFADRLLSETNEKAKRSGLPQLEPV